MKRLLIATLIFQLLSAVPSNAFFNRDCANLEKRTKANQATYEKSWDRYQTALGRWASMPNKDYMGVGVNEPINRLKRTVEISEKIWMDFQKNTKCINVFKSRTVTELNQIGAIKRDLDGNRGFALMKNYLTTPANHLVFIKK